MNIPLITTARILKVTVAAAMGLAMVAPAIPADEPASPVYTASAIRVAISHRVFVSFADTVTVDMHERRVVGDTEFSFEVVEFYPDFAIMDSTRAFVSVTAEPHNPAFKIRIYENEEQSEDTWAFFGVDIPHYGRNSYLAFKVLGFEYRGDMFGGAGASAPATQGEEERK
jgi:hypothetical protein